MTEQEASDEIRSLLQNFVIQLQSVKDRVPSRGSAMTTISILLDTTKPLSNSQTALVSHMVTAPTAIKKAVLAVNSSVSFPSSIKSSFRIIRCKFDTFVETITTKINFHLISPKYLHLVEGYVQNTSMVANYQIN